MDNVIIRKIVLFNPSGADFRHNLAYKELGVQHLDEEGPFLNFEYKGNRIASFDHEQQPSISVETETLTGTTTLSLRDNKPVVIINGRSNFANFAFERSVATYSTVPITSGYAEGLRIKFKPVCLSKRHPSLHRYSILDEQQGIHLGVLLVPVSGQEMTLAFEDGVSETQKRLIVGITAFIIADVFRVKQLANYFLLGMLLGFLVIFMIFLYFQ